jgi:hypothetical protein
VRGPLPEWVVLAAFSACSRLGCSYDGHIILQLNLAKLLSRALFNLSTQPIGGRRVQHPPRRADRCDGSRAPYGKYGPALSFTCMMPRQFFAGLRESTQTRTCRHARFGGRNLPLLHAVTGLMWYDIAER